MKKIFYAIIAVFLLISSNIFLSSDFIPFLHWWLIILIIGLTFMPTTLLIFSGFHDKGYLFSKAIGIAITGYLMWLFSSLRILKFSTLSCVLCLLISIVLNVLLITIKRVKGKVILALPNFKQINLNSLNKLINTIIGEELLFLALFLLFVYIRGFKPEAHGTEKFMDYGFMTSMMRQDYMAPQDFWFAGTKLNYYYVGQFIAVFLTRLSGVKVSLGYNLMLTMVGALAFVLAYSLVFHISYRYHKLRNAYASTVISTISGLLGGIAVCIAGNMHYPTFKYFQPLFQKFFGLEVTKVKYWFPDATRFIGYHPETHDKTIHEFPAYSFVLGDLHAHVINIIFVITVLAILFAWMCKRIDEKEKEKTLSEELFSPSLLLLSFFIGFFHTTNYWDYPIYYVVAGAIILFTNSIVYGFTKKTLILTGLQGVLIMALSQIICLPFTMNFDKIAGLPMLCVAHTPINKFIILWGLPFMIVIAFICFQLSDYLKNKREQEEQVEQAGQEQAEQEQQEQREEREEQSEQEQREAREEQEQKEQADQKDNKYLNIDESKIPFLSRFFRFTNSSDLFIMTIGLCAMGLVLIPEVIYIQDIYNGDYKRANTMFKLTYQAFIMFGISLGYIIPRILCFGKTMKQRKYGLLALILLALSVCYTQNAVHSWYGNILHLKGYKGLDATTFMNSTMRDDSLAIEWMNQHISGTPVILEAPGESYTDYERVSVISGLPTVLGWNIHEWLWKSNYDMVELRRKDIENIYSGTDITQTKELIKKYNISYIYIGKMELEAYPSISYDLLTELGEVVYNNDEDQKKEFETIIIRVSK